MVSRGAKLARAWSDLPLSSSCRASFGCCCCCCSCPNFPPFDNMFSNTGKLAQLPNAAAGPIYVFEQCSLEQPWHFEIRAEVALDFWCSRSLCLLSAPCLYNPLLKANVIVSSIEHLMVQAHITRFISRHPTEHFSVFSLKIRRSNFLN